MCQIKHISKHSCTRKSCILIGSCLNVSSQFLTSVRNYQLFSNRMSVVCSDLQSPQQAPRARENVDDGVLLHNIARVLCYPADIDDPACGDFASEIPAKNDAEYNTTPVARTAQLSCPCIKKERKRNYKLRGLARPRCAPVPTIFHSPKRRRTMLELLLPVLDRPVAASAPVDEFPVAQDSGFTTPPHRETVQFKSPPVHFKSPSTEESPPQEPKAPKVLRPGWMKMIATTKRRKAQKSARTKNRRQVAGTSEEPTKKKAKESTNRKYSQRLWRYVACCAAHKENPQLERDSKQDQ